MFLYNIFKLNNANLKLLLTIQFSIQLAMWGFVGIEYLGLVIPFLREILSIIYLLYIPGVIILRILRIHNIDTYSTVIYSVGISISMVYFIGFVLSIILPIFGNKSPISLIPLMISFTIMNLSLGIISVVRNKEIPGINYLDFSTISLKMGSLLCLIPSLAVIGTYFASSYSNSFVLIILIFGLSVVIISLGCENNVPEKLYPIIIGIFAISLIFHYSLITNYIVGWDVQLEYFSAKVIKNAGFWDLSFTGNTNSMLSVAILLPIFSIISNMDLIWALKIIFPLIFSLISIALFIIYRQQTNNKVALFSCIFFISFFPFYTELIALAKQEIAELFLVLVFMVVISNKLSHLNRSLLLIIFGSSVILSHYGVSYIFVFSLFFTIICIILLKIFFFIEFGNLRTKQINNIGIIRNSSPLSLIRYSNIINPIYLLLIISLLYVYYIFTSNSVLISSQINLLSPILENIGTVLDYKSVQGLDLLQKTLSSPIHNISKNIHILTQLFILYGFFLSLYNIHKTKFRIEYLFFSLSAIFLLFFGLTVPYFASSYNTSRLFHINLIFLAPFCVIGGLAIFNKIFLYLHIGDKSNITKYSYFLIACFFAIYLLFNSGWVYEIFKDDPTSPTLNRTLDASFFNEREVTGSTWLFSKKSPGIIYSDQNRVLLLTGFEGRKQKLISDQNEPLKNNSYIFSGTYNIENGVFKVRNYDINSFFLINHNKIYDNRGSQIYC